MDIKKLIEKYYEGKTSLEDEKYLRNVFANSTSPQPSPKERESSSFGGIKGGASFGGVRGGQACNDDRYNQLIFTAFSEEKEEKVPSSVKTFSPTGNIARNVAFFRKKWTYIASGIAACLVFAVGIQIYKYQQENTAYVIINGVRINDEKLAIQYVNDNFSKIDRSIEKGLAPLYEIEKIEDKLNKIIKNINY